MKQIELISSRTALIGVMSGLLTFGLTSVNSVQAQEEEASGRVEEVIVTGSRIERSNLSSTTPVVQIEAEEIKWQGTVRVEDALRQMPQIWSRQNTGQSNGATGTATLDLRNLGPSRTLFLINGRRMPAGSPIQGGSGADINQIPGSLINRVEVLTGGASATYGSDAVSGVVNFVMDDKFEGVAFDFQHSFYRHANDDSGVQEIVKASGFDVADEPTSDGEITQYSLSIGGNFLNGGNIVAYATYRDIKALTQAQRDYSSCALNNTADGCWGSSTIPEGRITNFQNPDHIGFDYKVDGSTFVPRAGTLFNYGPRNYFQRPDERTSFGTFATYDISDQTEVFAEFMFADDHTVSQIAPSGAFFVTNTLFCGNPFLSGQQYDLLTQNRLSTDQQAELDMVLAKLTPERQEAYLDSAFCQNKVDDYIDVFIGRRNLEGGNRQQDLRHTSGRMVAGIKHAINDSWQLEIFGQRSIVSMENTYLNDLGVTKIRRALDATMDADGNVVCRSVLDGSDPNCVAWNIFQTGGVADEAIDYLVLPLFARGTTEQSIMGVYVEGDMTDAGWKFPTSNESVIFVLGAERRIESLDFKPDSGFLNGEGAGQGGATNAVAGGYSVNELFAEASIPLLEGEGLVDSLLLDTSYRFSDYSNGNETHTWGIRLGWDVTSELTFRTSVQRAVRSASVRELFSPQGFNLFDMSADPCSGEIGADGTTTAGYTFEQCARTGVTSAHWGNIQDSPAGQYNYLQGGNIGLEPEESDTFLIGLVYQPGLADGFAITLDFYDIEISGGISAITPEFTITECLNGNLSQCSKVKRNTTRGDLWIGSDVNSSGHVEAIADNLAIERVTGFDAILSYSMSVGDYGTVDFENNLGFITSWEQQELSTAPKVECKGLYGGVCGIPTPDIQNNLRAIWTTPWNITVSGLWRHISETEGQATGIAVMDSVDYIDVAAYYDWTENYRVSVGVNNLFDSPPPIVGNPAGPSIGGNGNIFPGSYDGFGQYVYVRLGINL